LSFSPEGDRPLFYTTRFGKRFDKSFDAEKSFEDSTQNKLGQSFDFGTDNLDQTNQEQVLARIQNFLEGKFCQAIFVVDYKGKLLDYQNVELPNFFKSKILMQKDFEK
jgi:hypothetical protein